MRRMFLLSGFMAMGVAVAVVTINGASAHGDDNEYRDPGYGMEYPMESEMTEEYCPGCGMMGSHGAGPGMMGDYGMGHGMMGGNGMGPGMMGSYGMMGAGPMSGLELNRDQRKQMLRIQSELRKQNWALQGEILDAREQLFELYLEDTLDAKKIGAVYAKIFDLRRQMIEAGINAHNRQRTVLTEEQRQQLRYRRHGNGPGGHRSMPQGMGPQHGGQMMGG